MRLSQSFLATVLYYNHDWGTFKVFLIIDEIQELLKSKSGRDLLKALKAARDAVNLRPENSKQTFLQFVGVGSHRFFMTAMTSCASQPFYGADRVDFPLLNDGFIDWMMSQPGANDQKISGAVLKQGLSVLGNRPKALRDVLRNMQSYTGSDPEGAFLAVCRNQARVYADEFLSEVTRRDLLTKTIFTEIAKSGTQGCSNHVWAHHPYKANCYRCKKKDWIYPVSYGNYSVSDPQVATVWLENLDDYMTEL